MPSVSAEGCHRRPAVNAYSSPRRYRSCAFAAVAKFVFVDYRRCRRSGHLRRRYTPAALVRRCSRHHRTCYFSSPMIWFNFGEFAIQQSLPSALIQVDVPFWPVCRCCSGCQITQAKLRPVSQRVSSSGVLAGVRIEAPAPASTSSPIVCAKDGILSPAPPLILSSCPRRRSAGHSVSRPTRAVSSSSRQTACRRLRHRR